MDLLSVLSRKLSLLEIREIVAFISGDDGRLDTLWRQIYSEDRRVSVNALWVLTHLDEPQRALIHSRRRELTDMLLSATDVAKKRMLLQLLRDLDYSPGDIRTDLIDYCLSKINSECEPYAVRAFSIYLSFKLTHYYPELLAELEMHLSMLKSQELSSGLKSALRQTEKRISRSRRQTSGQ